MPNFTPQEIVFGAEGLDFQRTLDQVSPLRVSVGSNWIIERTGRLTHRAGETAFGTLSDSPVHTLDRLGHPTSGDRILIGAGTVLYLVPETGGVATSVETGFSGDPLSVVVGHTALTGEPWAFVADGLQMRKVRAVDNLSLPIGLSKAGPLFAAVDVETKSSIDTFDNTGVWANGAGTGGAPANVYDNTDFKEGTHALQFTSDKGSATGGYYNFWGKAYGLDLSLVTDIHRKAGSPRSVEKLRRRRPLDPRGVRQPSDPRTERDPIRGDRESVIVQPRTAADEDHFHLWLRTDRPDKILEIRIYFVISSIFTAGTVPGTSDTDNTDAYIKIIRPSDFTSSDELALGATAQAQLANLVQQIIDQLPDLIDGRVTMEDLQAQIERARSASEQLASGRGTWTEFGVVGRTLQRGEFRRIGADTDRDWSTVTGIIMAVQTVDDTDGIKIWLDDLYFFGGFGPDSSQPTAASYDWRSINYDPRTAARSLPSDVFEDEDKLDLIRRRAILTPSAYGDSSVRQRFYRRGGTLGSDWFFLGENDEDGGTFEDELADLEIIAADPLILNDDAPVTTTDRNGNIIRGHPLTSIFGPISDILFGCGDSHHGGRLYWSKPTEFEHWPAANYVDVCPDGEPLQAGFLLGGQGFVFSTERLFAVYPNLSDSRIVTTNPTSCQKAPISRWAFAVGFGLCFFIERDGIYATNGGPEENLTDGRLRPIFHDQDVGTAVLTQRSIDFSAVDDLRLFVIGDYLWFLYKDRGAARRVLRYNIVLKHWEGTHDFATPIAAAFDDVLGKRVLMGGASSAVVVENRGADDLGTPIAVELFTGAFNQGLPRQKKRYADIYAEFSGNLTTLTVTPYRDKFKTALAASALVGTLTQDRYYVDFDPVDAYDLGLRIQWTVPSNQVPVYLYKGGISFIPLPDEVEQRVTDWEAAGRLTDKNVKGVVLECDTFGTAKSIEVQADGATIATLSVTASGQQVLQFSFAQARARLLRLRPADEVRWILYRHSWLFDEEPLSLTRWESQELTLGAVGWKTAHFGQITLLSTTDVTLTVVAHRQDGTSVSKDYTIPSTSGNKRTLFVPFDAMKGVLYKFTFTSASPFYLYREETILWVHNWTTNQSHEIKPFGNDDLDLVRSMQDASLTAARGGGG